RAGVEPHILNSLTGDQKNLSQSERAAVEFSRKMTSAAYSVTDEEVADLIKSHGEKQVVAIVQLLAFANFQDRLVHSLGVSSSAGGLPPLDMKFVQAKDAPTPLPRKMPSDPPMDSGERFTDPDWLSVDFTQLQKMMTAQRARRPRIRVPSWDEVVQNLPAK